MRTFTIFALLSAVTLSSVSSGFASPTIEFSIVNSTLADLQIVAPAGSKLTISNSRICEGSSHACAIVVEAGARLELTNTHLGDTTTIYLEDAASQNLEMSNTEFAGKIQNQLPESYQRNYGSVAAARDPRGVPPRDFTNVKMENFTVRSPRDGRLEFTNVHLCERHEGDECRVELEGGAVLEASNAVFGARVAFVTPYRYASNLELSNVKFYGRFVEGGIVKPSVRPVQEADNSKENERVVRELQANKIAAETSERGVVINLPDVFFEFNKSGLTPDAQTNVAQIARVLNSVHGRVISVEGHADAIGSEAYNQRLSEARAESVYLALKKQGIDGRSMNMHGFGKRHPVAENYTEAGRARNRRVEIVLENSGRASDITAKLNRNARDRLIPNPRGSDERTEVQIRKDGISVDSENTHVRLDQNGIRVETEEADNSEEADSSEED